DIDDLPLVINYELPYVPEDYIHRIGRTGRAGASGLAMSFVAPDEQKLLDEIEKLLKKKVPIATAEGFDPVVSGTRRSDAAASRERTHAARAPRTESGTRAPSESASRRHEERERAYALNPDQPRIVRPDAPATPSPLARAHPVGAGRHQQ